MKTPPLTTAIVAAGIVSLSFLTTASAGTLFASMSNNTIAKFDASGAETIFSNTGLNKPYGLAFDNVGNLFVANFGGSTILKIAPNGAESVFATGSGNESALFGPTGLAFDKLGNLYAANYGFVASEDSTIEKFTPAGVGSVFASNPGDTSVLHGPVALAFDQTGNLYVANAGSSTVEKITPGGVASVFINSGLDDPWGLAFDHAGDLYVSSQNSSSIEKYSPDGIHLGSFANLLNNPRGIAFDSAGDLYAALNDNTIRKFGPTGTDLGVFADTHGDTANFIVIRSVPESSSTLIHILPVFAFLFFRTMRKAGRD